MSNFHKVVTELQQDVAVFSEKYMHLVKQVNGLQEENRFLKEQNLHLNLLLNNAMVNDK